MIIKYFYDIIKDKVKKELIYMDSIGSISSNEALRKVLLNNFQTDMSDQEALQQQHAEEDAKEVQEQSES